MIFAILSTVTILATLATLSRAIKDRRERTRLGINGALALLAKHAVFIEWLRVLKHLLLAASVWTTVLSYPMPWLNTVACATLGLTSIVQMWFRHQAERKVEQDKRAAALKALQLQKKPQ